MALDLETINTRQFDKLAEVIGIQNAKDFIELPTPDLENAYSDYHVERKRRLDALKEIEEYKNDVENIKAIKSAERDRIKPEKNLFDLALMMLEMQERGGEVNLFEVYESKPYKRCVKSSGDEYTREFCEKHFKDLQDYCVRFYIIKKKVERELAENEEYQDALARKKAAEDDVAIDLREMELRAKLAMVELKNRKDMASE